MTFTKANAAEMSRRGNKLPGGRAGYAALVNKYGKGGAMRILAEAIAKRPMTEPEREMYGILLGMGLEIHTSYICECPDSAYAVDFYLPAHKLVIQVDGGYWHEMDGRHERDLAVDAKLAMAGFKVHRVVDEVVMRMPAVAHADIELLIAYGS